MIKLYLIFHLLDHCISISDTIQWYGKAIKQVEPVGCISHVFIYTGKLQPTCKYSVHFLYINYGINEIFAIGMDLFEILLRNLSDIVAHFLPNSLAH